MTILLVSQVFPPRPGGSGRWLWELYRRLTHARVHVVAGDVTGADAFDRNAPMPITRLPLDFASWGVMKPRSAVQYARGVTAIGTIARQCKADVIHCGKCLPEGLLGTAIAWRAGIPCTVYVHGEELALARTTRELRYWTMFVLRRAARIVANSDHSQRLLTREWHVPAEKIAVLHPGVDTSRFTPAPPDAALRRHFGWAGRSVVLTVGALQKRKGQDMMIRALPAIRAACPDVLYAIAGEGWERPYLEALARDCGVKDLVQFRGVPSDDELVPLYQQCDLFALANRAVGWDIEGFGIALIEAQAAGRPVIAGRSGGAPETTRDGVTGQVVDCETPAPLAAAVTSLLGAPDRRRQMGLNARQWAMEQFDWQVLAQSAGRLLTDGRTAGER